MKFGRTDTQEILELPIVNGEPDLNHARRWFKWTDPNNLPIVPVVETPRPNNIPNAIWNSGIDWSSGFPVESWILQTGVSFVPSVIYAKNLWLYLADHCVFNNNIIKISTINNDPVPQNLYNILLTKINKEEDVSLRLKLQIQFSKSEKIERNHPVTSAMIYVMNLTSEQADFVFINAENYEM